MMEEMRGGLRLSTPASASAAVGFLVLALGLTTAAELAPGDGIRSWIYGSIAVAGALAFCAGLALGRPRLPWLLFATGFALWAADSGIRYGDPSYDARDLLYALGFPLIVAGAIALVRPSKDRVIDALLDAGIVGTGAGLFLWQIAFEPATHSISIAAELTGALLPTLDVVLVVVVAQLLASQTTRGLAGVRALVGGFGLLLASDVAYAALYLYDGTTGRSLIVEVGRFGAYALFGFAALHPSTARAALPAQRLLQPVRSRLALLGISSLAAPASLVIAATRGAVDDTLAVGLWGCALVIFLYIRLARLFAQRASAQAHLHDTQRTLETAQEMAEIGGWVSDLGPIETISWSKACARIFGVSLEAFDGRIETFLDLVHPDDRVRVAEHDSAATAGEGSYELEYRIVRPDGQVRWIYDRGDLVRDASGRPSRLVGVVQDITDRREADRALRTAEVKYRTLVEQLPLVTYIHKGTLGQPPVYVSPQLQTLLGYSVSDWMSNAETFWEIVHPDDREILKEETRRFGQDLDQFECEYRLVAADGREVWVLDQMVAVEDAEARPDFFQGFLVDITERKLAEQGLEDAEARYRTLVENLPLTSYVSGLSADFMHRYISPQIEQLLGYTADQCTDNPELLGRIIHPDDLDRVVEEARRMRRDLDRSQLEYRVIARDGRTVWVFDEMVTVRDEQGEPVGLQGFLLDVTERKQLEEQLEQSRRIEVVGRLAGGIAHDFNNLLTVITGYSGLALDRMGSDDTVVRGHVEEVQRAAESAASLTQQMLAFSRRQVLQPRVLELSSVVAGIQELLGRMVGEHIELDIDAVPETPRVLADPAPLEQVLVNLAANACDAMLDGGRLSIVTRAVDVGPDAPIVTFGATPGRYAALIVTDTGVGMDAATLEHVFEPFFTTKEVGEGSGLGLSSVFGIVRQSGGWTWIESEPGEGTTVTVYLPSTETAPVAEQEPVSGREPGESRVLLVEDEPVVRALVAEMLEGQGYEVVAAASPHDALELADEHGCELLVTDVVMPGMNGRELATRLRERFPELQVVFTSGYTEDTVLQRGGFGPGERFLPKPFTEADLATIVREALDALPAPVT
jgi:PAS domain S-box-containing protein